MSNVKNEIAILVLEQQANLLASLQKINATYSETIDANNALLKETLETIALNTIKLEKAVERNHTLSEEISKQRVKYEELKNEENILLDKNASLNDEIKLRQDELVLCAKNIDEVTASIASLKNRINNYEHELVGIESELANQKEIASLGLESNELLKRDEKKIIKHIYDKKVELKLGIERAKEEYQKLNITTAQFYEISEIEATLYSMNKKLDKYLANTQTKRYQEANKQDV